MDEWCQYYYCPIIKLLNDWHLVMPQWLQRAPKCLLTSKLNLKLNNNLDKLIDIKISLKHWKANKETSFTVWPYLLGKKMSNNLQLQGNWPKLYSKFELTSMKGRFCSEIWLEWIRKRNAEPWLCEGQGILWSQPCFCGIMHKNWSLQCN